MKLNWKKTGLVVMDIALGAYLIAAFTAFNKPDEAANLCTKVNINIQDESTNGFINAKEIKNRLEKQLIYPLSKKMVNINTRQIEESLKKISFRKDCRMLQNSRWHGVHNANTAHANSENKIHKWRRLLYRR